MKGISTIIATILMLMITIGLAGTAYLYISGSFSRQTQGIELADGFCNAGTTATIIFRNAGIDTITFDPDSCGTGNTVNCGGIIVTRTAGAGTATIVGNAASLAAGATGTITDAACSGAATPDICVYRVTPPAGRGFEARISCP